MSLDAAARGQGNGQWPSWTERHTHTNPQDQIATYIVLFLQFCSTISGNWTICLIGSSWDSPLQRTLDVSFTNYKSAFICSNTHHYKGDRRMRLCRWGLCIWDWTYSPGTALWMHIHRSNETISIFKLSCNLAEGQQQFPCHRYVSDTDSITGFYH